MGSCGRNGTIRTIDPRILFRFSCKIVYFICCSNNKKRGKVYDVSLKESTDWSYAPGKMIFLWIWVFAVAASVNVSAPVGSARYSWMSGLLPFRACCPPLMQFPSG